MKTCRDFSLKWNKRGDMLCKLLYITHSIPLCRQWFRSENAQKLLKFVTRLVTASQRQLSAWNASRNLLLFLGGNSIIFGRWNWKFVLTQLLTEKISWKTHENGLKECLSHSNIVSNSEANSSDAKTPNVFGTSCLMNLNMRKQNLYFSFAFYFNFFLLKTHHW
jgi:hypothetical protein